MENIYDTISRITGPEEGARQLAQQRWDSIAKPLGSLGQLETAVTKIAALRGSADVSFKNRRLLVFCADNGVVARGVSQCGSEVTAHVAVALAEGRSTVSPMARQAGCEVIPVDMGMLDFPGHPGVWDRRVRNGTADISTGPAMTRAECLRAMETGAELAETAAQEGVSVLLLGEMGIGNTTTSGAVCAALLGLTPDEVTGRGAGLSDAGLARKRAAVESALSVNAPDRNDAVDVLQKVGGLDLAAMCGAFLGAAAARLPVIIDGYICAVAALCAARLCPDSVHAFLASHVSAEPAAQRLLRELGLEAPITAGMRLGEGSGAVALLPLL
ncbi:MAG: nicotinate-nucleotide--dimethylbenzimidazole phosphoribosyltransferase, partial [Desulfovibrio sp.]|nr:nicotinate-nucleotide--dimethylbenzimidazole phosphoribosyltransferase [Desulfovibrio sp.]